MKQYLLSVHSVEGSAPPPPEVMQRGAYDDVAAFNTELQGAGAWVLRRRPAPAEHRDGGPGPRRRCADRRTARSQRARSTSAASG